MIDDMHVHEGLCNAECLNIQAHTYLLALLRLVKGDSQ